MFKKLKLTSTIMLLIGISTTIALALTIVIISIMSRNMAKDSALRESKEIASRYSNEVKAELEVSLDTARTLAQTFEGMKATYTPERSLMDNILKNVLGKDSRFTGVWTLWEPDALDGKDSLYVNKPGHDKTGRFLPYWNRGSGSIKLEPIVDYETGDFYNYPKKTGKETITNPYTYPISGKNVLMSSIVVPIKYKNKFVGVAGIDVILETIQKKIDKIKPYDTGYLSLISNNGVYVTDINKKNVLKPLGNKKLKELIKAGKGYVDTSYSAVLKEESYKIYVPVKMGNTMTPWSLVVNIPMSKIMQKSNKMRNYSILLGLIALTVLIVIIYVITRNIVTPIKQLTNIAENIAADNLSVEINVLENQDEIGDLSRAFSKMQHNLKGMANMAEKIAQGDLSDQELIENGDLTNAFRKMFSNLNLLIKEVDKLTKSVEEGNLSVRGSTENFYGGWSELIVGVNELIDAVVEPIKESSMVLKEMANGNMDTCVNGDYKGEHSVIKENLNLTINNINKILWEVNDSANLLDEDSKKVLESSTALAQGATEQASAIEEITSSMGQLADQTRQNAIHSNKAKELSLEVKNNGTKGKDQMKNMLSSMQDMNDSSSSISKIIKVIDEIAFQTNILALNAAVEAARAGQYGKGFAVVAEEVKNLAERSSRAAKETTEMIETSIKKVESGTTIANETAVALNEIVNGVSKVSELSDGIAESSNEQATAISQINQAVAQVAEILNVNSEKVEGTTSANEELSSQANKLKTSLSKFALKSKDDVVESFNSQDMNFKIEELVEKIIAQKTRTTSKNKDYSKSSENNKNKTKILFGENNHNKYW
jgi:methyl-accepting chemotaxis protein